MSRLKPSPKIDLEPFQKAVNEAAAGVRTLWLGYIALLAYMFITVGAVTHRDLLLEQPVRLPVLNVELPLVGFFAVAPLFVLINHFYLLLQLMGLGRRIRKFNDEIAKSRLGEEGQLRERYKLDTFVIVQMLGGTTEERNKLSGWFLQAIALITVVLAPVALLLFIQLRFLPYQSEWITWWHRILLCADLILLLRFWTSIKLGEWARWPGWMLWQNWSVRQGFPSPTLLAQLVPWRALLAVTILLFACVIATFPGEKADGGINAEDWSEPEHSYLWPVKGWLFGDLERLRLEKGQPRTEGWFFLARAIDLADNTTLIDLDKFDKITKRHRDNNDRLKPWEMDRTLSLRKRNLRGARFDRSDLRNVDLSQANLQGASLFGARLQGASLADAHLQGASLEYALLQGVSLARAELQGVLLRYARLQGALLFNARLQGALLADTHLQGASLAAAHLQGALLDGAHLQGASLFGARLQGASLASAHLQGASLSGAHLQGASLHFSLLHSASFDGADLQGASLAGTRLQEASLVGTYLWRVHGTPDPGNPVRVRIEEPQVQEATAEQLAYLERDALDGVDDDAVRERIKKALARLSAPEKDIHDSPPRSFWVKLMSKVSDAEHKQELADRLQPLDCDNEKGNAPYVAQGLVSVAQALLGFAPSRLEAVGPSHLPIIAKTLLDAAEGRTTGCPGARGLNAASIAQLRRWTATAEHNKTHPAQ